MSDSKDGNVNNEKKEKLNEIEKKFNFLAHEVSKTYLDKTKLRHKELETKITNFVILTENKIFNKCEDKIKTIMEISENEQLVDQAKGNIVIQMKPKYGREEEYNLQSGQLMNCVRPYLSLAENVLEYRNFFQQLNNYSYSFCLNECKMNLMNSVANNTVVNYDNLKNCLKDCYNLGSFNFKSYYEYTFRDVDNKVETLSKL